MGFWLYLFLKSELNFSKLSLLIEGKYIAASGMGEFRPAELKGGTSRWNRRVEIVIRGRGSSAQNAAHKVESYLSGD